jgi:hypothetical protein
MPLQINSEYQSGNYLYREEDELIQFLVFHYTAAPLGTTLGISTNNVDLAEEGIGIWYDLTESNIQMPENLEDVLKLAKEKLTEFGYDCWLIDIQDEINFKNVIKAFQMHFRPSNIDGIIDLECLQILDSLCQRKLKYEDELKKAETPKLTLKAKF